VVKVSHRQCRHHPWMDKLQWRLSFSRAEIVLINTWMPVQQIVYHMLRFFVKTERLTDTTENSDAATLSNYHIKTLMLWACELKPRSLWTENLNLVNICVELLHNLSVWLIGRRCQHYFINDCNLIDDTFSVEMVARKLLPISEMYLSVWFAHRYIGKCCCKHVKPDMNMQTAVSAIIDCRLSKSLRDLWYAYQFAEYGIARTVHEYSVMPRSCISWKTELEKIDVNRCLLVYFTAVAFLRLGHDMPTFDCSDELIDALSTVLGHFIDDRRYCYEPGNKYSLCNAARLMKVVANKSRSTVQLIKIELSKAYLHRTLRLKDSDSDSIYCLANVYLAVLYYTTGQYQTAIDHCTLVMRSQDHSQCSSHVVQGELLPKIDDDIDTALGLAVLYQFVLSAALNQRQQRQYSSVFTTKLFVCYLHIKFLSVIKYYRVAQLSLLDVYQRYEQCISGTQQLFISDTLIVKSLSCALEQGPIRKKLEVRKYDRIVISERKIKTSELVELLQQSAVEHLTTYRQLKAQVFTSVVEMAATDYEALYTYKRGDYQRCLLLSTQNARTRQHTDYKPSIFTLPCFILLMDDDIVSLIALVLIVNPECRDAVKKTCINQVTLSLYLMAQCQLKLHHSVTSLARTLECISVALRKTKYDAAFDQLTLKLASRKLISSSQQKQTIG